MEKGICYVFGAGEVTSCDIHPTENDLVIAADGGYDYAKNVGIQTTVQIGDFDSIADSDLPPNRIVHPCEKDDTDMMLVLKYGMDKGYTMFHIYGGLGGRLDHTMANIQALSYLAHHGAKGILFGEDYCLTVIRKDFLWLPAQESGYVSVFSLSEKCRGVTIRDLKYPLKNADISNQMPLGVSNEFVGNDARITVKKGTLAVLWYNH